MVIPDLDSLRIMKFKALSEPIRLKMLSHLSEPRTVKQVADILGVDHHALYHHMRVLEKAEIVKLIKTRDIGNITEKYYQLIDNWIEMFETQDKGSAIQPIVRQWAISILEDLTKSFQSGSDLGTVHRVFLSVKKESLTEKLAQINEMLRNMTDKLSEMEDKDGDLTYTVNFIHFVAPETIKNLEEPS